LSGHHLVLGELQDFLSGDWLPDTHDERYRQKIARLLVECRGFAKADIEARRRLTVRAGGAGGIVKIDYLVRHETRIGMLIKFGPGSLVTRRRPVLALSRLVEPYQIPVAVVTNGEDAEILEAASGTLIAAGMDRLPSKRELAARMQQADFEPIDRLRAEMEARIVYCYEIDGACPCDEEVCRI
jgi:hypothetical protein